MANVYDYITEDGVIVPDAGVIREEVTDEYLDEFGSDLVVDSTTPTAQAILINAETSARIAVADNNAQLANQINPNQAGGVFLDALMALLGSYSIAGYPTTVLNVVVTGAPGAVIEIGSQVQNTQNNAIFYNTEQLIIPDSGTITNAIFKCTENGPISCNVGALTQILSNYDAWETVTNPQAGTPGQLSLSDAQKKNLRKQTVAANSSGSAKALISGLLLIPGVTSLKLIENYYSTTMVIQGVTMVKNSLYACVAGSATNQEIGEGLTSIKNFGCAYNNGYGIQESVVITDPYSLQPITVLFDRPSQITINVRITIGTYATVVDVIDNVKQAVVSYANGEMPNQPGFVVGASVSPYEIAGAVMYFVQGVFVKQVEVAVQGMSFQGDISTGSPIIVGIPSTTGLASGQVISGEGIPDGVTIISTATPNQITISANATETIVNNVLTSTKALVYQGTEVPMSIWQQAYTNINLVQVVSS